MIILLLILLLEFLCNQSNSRNEKAIDKMAGGQAPGGTQSPGLMPGMGNLE